MVYISTGTQGRYAQSEKNLFSKTKHFEKTESPEVAEICSDNGRQLVDLYF